MKKVFQLGLLVAALFVMSGIGNDVVAQKIAVVDTEKILAASPEVKRANTQLQTLKKQFEKRLESKYKTFEAKYQKGLEQAKAGTLTKNAEVALQKELQRLEKGIAASQKKMQTDLLKKEEQYLKPILEKVRKTITAIAKKKGYRYVFNKNSMIYFPPADDITGAVKASLGYK